LKVIFKYSSIFGLHISDDHYVSSIIFSLEFLQNCLSLFTQVSEFLRSHHLNIILGRFNLFHCIIEFIMNYTYFFRLLNHVVLYFLTGKFILAIIKFGSLLAG